ncbi:MAG: FAD-dependent oxidoreductase [Rhodoferax sp.]
MNDLNTLRPRRSALVWRAGLLLVLATLALLWWWLAPNEAAWLAAVKAQMAGLQTWHQSSPWQCRAAFFVAYLLLATFAIPGIAVVTMAAGAVLGVGWGVLLVSFASTLGATLSFWLARYLLADLLRARMGPRVQAVRQHIEREGALYLLSLRLIPVVPFGLINLLMGLTRMRTWTFYAVSQVGMLASTVIYVAAGQQLARLSTARDVLSPALLAGLVVAGLAVSLLPLVGKGVMSRLQQGRMLAPWRRQRPRQFDTNLVVIGAGAAGLVSAYVAAAAQAKVTLVEERALGGDCLHYGCVPSKALIHCAKVAQQVRGAAQFGVLAPASSLDFPAVMAHVHRAIARIAPHDSVARYTALGVDVLPGHATIVNPWTVEVSRPGGDPQRITTRAIVVAAGAQPVVPDLPGLHEVGYATSDTLWGQLAQCTTLPARIVLLGGGPIGCELGQAFARLGAAVTVVESGEHLLPREDAEVCELVQVALQGDGARVLTQHSAVRCTRGQGEAPQKSLVVRDLRTGQEQALPFDLLVCALGRRARLQGYGLEAMGIATDRRVPTNTYLQTVFPTIYAAGDVAGPYQLTHAAAHQAWYASVNALFGGFKRFAADYRHLPVTTFVSPEVARVGLNVQEASAQGVAFEVTRFELADLDRALCEAGDASPTGFVKVLTVPGSDRILGVTIVADRAAEMLTEYVLAMRKGLGLKAVLGTVHAYPTFTEANKYAAGNWQRAHVPARLLRAARWFHTWRRG